MNHSILTRLVAATWFGTALLACASAQEDTEATWNGESEVYTVEIEGEPGAVSRQVIVRPRTLTMTPTRTQETLRIGPRVRLFEPRGPLLGVSVDLTPDGLLVTEVDEGSLAASAGVMADDVLLRVGQTRIGEVADVARALRGTRPGQEVTVAVVRANQGIVELTGTAPEPPHEAAPDGHRGGFLGVELGDEDEDAGTGVHVAGVVPDSAAWYAGLEEGDRLLGIDETTVGNYEDVVGAISSREPGTMVTLRYLRDSDEHTARVRLGRQSPVDGLLGRLPGMQWFGDGSGMRLHLGEGFEENDWTELMEPHGEMFFAPELDGPHGEMHFGPDIEGLMMELHHDGADLPGDWGDYEHSLKVRIEDDHMTIERDGQVEHYERGADGQWVLQGGETEEADAPRER